MDMVNPSINTLLKKVDSRYPTVLITRKVFFYGMLTILPYFIFRPMTMTLQMLAEPVIFDTDTAPRD